MYDKYEVNKKTCNCQEKKDTSCKTNICKKIELTPYTPEKFTVTNYFSELVHEWEKEMARHNLGISELENIEYKVEQNKNGECLTKVIFKYRKGHELVTREFYCAPKGDKGDKGEKGDKGDTGARGADGRDGANGNDGITPTLTKVTINWSNTTNGYFEHLCDNLYELILNLEKPDSITALTEIIDLINSNLIQNYVTQTEFRTALNSISTKDTFSLSTSGNNIVLYKNGDVISTTALPEIPLGLTTIPRATDTEVGGIKTGYLLDDVRQRYPVNLNGSGQAYVEIPWESGDLEDFNIDDYKQTIKRWQEASISDLRSILSDANADILALNLWKVAVTDDTGENIDAALILSKDKVAAALKKDQLLSGLTLDILEQQNALVLAQGENGAYLILKIGDDGSNTVISSDNILLDGAVIADKINAKDIMLSGSLNAKTLNFIEDENENRQFASYYENIDNLNLYPEDYHRMIFIITYKDPDNKTTITGIGCDLIFEADGQPVNATKMTLEPSSVYVCLNTKIGWYIRSLQSSTQHIADTDEGENTNVNQSITIEPVNTNCTGTLNNGSLGSFTALLTDKNYSSIYPNYNLVLRKEIRGYLLYEDNGVHKRIPSSFVIWDRTSISKGVLFKIAPATTITTDGNLTEADGQIIIIDPITSNEVFANYTTAPSSFIRNLVENGFLSLVNIRTSPKNSPGSKIIAQTLPNGTVYHPNSKIILGYTFDDGGTDKIINVAGYDFAITYGGGYKTVPAASDNTAVNLTDLNPYFISPEDEGNNGGQLDAN